MVRIPRCAYAMILQQSWHPPPTLPNPPSHHPDYKASDLGAKLAVGLEILYQESARRLARQQKQQSSMEAAPSTATTTTTPVAAEENQGTDADPGWVAYRDALKRLDYFRVRTLAPSRLLVAWSSLSGPWTHRSCGVRMTRE